METRCTCGAGHATFGACIRAKNLRVAFCGQGDGDASAQKAWDRDLDLYFSAVRQGIEPAGTTRRKVTEALRLSDEAGKPYDATVGGFSE